MMPRVGASLTQRRCRIPKSAATNQPLRSRTPVDTGRTTVQRVPENKAARQLVAAGPLAAQRRLLAATAQWPDADEEPTPVSERTFWAG